MMMTRILLLFISFFLLLSLPRTNGSMATLYSAQGDQPLTLNQIERLLEIKVEDEVIAREIRTRGLAFRLDDKTLENLLKRGAGELTRQALLRQEERAAYLAYANEKQDAARRLALGREFLRKYPQSEYAKDVEAGNRRTMREIFSTEFQAFSRNPDAARLNRLLALGHELLDQQPEREVVVEVTTQLALATGRGMLGNFYSDLERSRNYARQATRLLEETSPAESEANTRLRNASMSLLLQVQGLYLLRQPEPDPEQAIVLLTRAAALKDGPSANDPTTYWLRALASDAVYQKLRDQYQTLSKTQRLGAQGQSLCGRIAPLAKQIVEDYAQVIALGGAAETRALHDEAVAALTTFSTSDRPCLAGRRELIEEWPDSEKRFALVIGVEDYQDIRISRFNHAATDARALADALAQSAGFKREQITLLASSEPAERQPTRSAILRHLAGLQGRVTQDGLLLIFFAGHAIERDGKAYLLPSDALANDASLLRETAVSVDRVKELIRATEAGQVVLIFDAFRQQPVAGAVSADNPLTESFTREVAFDTNKREATAFAALFASSVGQRAYEWQSKKQGYFASALIEAIKGRAANRQREVTLNELVKYLQTAVPQETQRDLGQNAQQRPQAVIEGYQADELVVALAESGGQATARASKPDPGELLRSAKTVFIRSKTIYLNPNLLERELAKHPDFQTLGLKIVKNEKEADLALEVTLPFLTWTWTYTLNHQASNTPLANGKIREITAGVATPKLAADVIARAQSLRSPAATPKK
jgi:uncharacterized caspase-like protein